jgi:hypothetical protein
MGDCALIDGEGFKKIGRVFRGGETQLCRPYRAGSFCGCVSRAFSPGCNMTGLSALDCCEMIKMLGCCHDLLVYRMRFDRASAGLRILASRVL